MHPAHRAHPDYQASTQVVKPSNRNSADLLPVAQNFIDKNGTVSAYEKN